MRPLFPTLLTLATGLALPAMAQQTRGPMPFSQLLGGQQNPEEEESEKSAIPAISLLPNGSILENVMIPRYNGARKLSTVLRCKTMVLERSDLISGQTVSIETFNPDRTVRARVDLSRAVYNQKDNLVTADEAITIDAENVTANGTGLVYAIETGRGFLHGPVVTTLAEQPATAMNPARPALRATALLGASILPLIAAPPAPPTPAEKTTLERDASSFAGQAAEAGKEARTELRSILASSEQANKATTEFLDKADLLAASGAAEAPAPNIPAPELKVAGLTTIKCDGGMYLDPALSPTESVLVYLKNVDVKDPRFALKSQELKIFFEKTPEPPKKAAAKDKPAAPTAKDAKAETPAPADKPASPEETPQEKTAAPDAAKDPKDAKDTKPKEKDKAKEEKSGSIGGMDFGDPRRIVATGAVVIDTTAEEGKDSVKGAGAFFSYDLKTGDIYLRGGAGGNCWFMQGDKLMKASRPNLGVRINRDGGVYADEGPWENYIVMPQDKKN